MGALTPPRIDILGTPVDCVDMSESLTAVERLLKGDQAKTVIAVNPEKVIKSREDKDLKNAIETAGLLIPDGIGVVLAARMNGSGPIKRVPGSELMPAICEMSAQKGYSVYLYGASPDVSTKAVSELRHRYGDLEIAGHDHGYLSDDQMPDLVDRINKSGAQILFIALGSPRQERWMARFLPELTTIRVCQGVGGTFDVIAGEVLRAPLIFRRFNLEWLYRLISQPKRLLRQTALPRFAYEVLAQKLSFRSKTG